MANGNDDSLEMDTELELEDGTVVTLGDLMRQAAQANQLRGQVQDLNRFRDNATKLMRGEAPDAQAAYEVLRGAGFSDADARQYAQEYVDNEGRAGGEEDVSDEEQIQRMLKQATRDADQRAEAALLPQRERQQGREQRNREERRLAPAAGDEER